MRQVALTALIVLSAACSRHAPPSEGTATVRDGSGPASADAGSDVAASAAASASASAGDASLREPLGGYPWQFDLTDPPGFTEEGAVDASADASVKATKLGCVSVPLGTREPRPIVVALHGGGDRPDWACGEWRGVSNGYPFLVCPRGPGASDSALGWSSPADTKTRIARAIAATKKIFGSWIREVPIVLVGFSMGATQTALLARAEPAIYPRVALSESAYAPEPAMAFAAPWAKGGGQRALFGCTTVGCEPTYRSAARNVARNHVPARLNIAGTNQHGIWDVVVRSMRRDWPWLIDKAEGWEAYVPPVEETPLPGKSETFEPE